MPYWDLKSFQQAAAIYDFTVEFCDRYIDKKSRTHDQMVQAARSGKQNIAEGGASGKAKIQQEEYLTRIAYASFKELLEDYQDFLRQRRLPQWEKDDPRAVEVRRIPYRSYKTYEKDMTYTTYTSYKTSTTYEAYRIYLDDPERAANAMICLINQTTYLLDQQLEALKKQMEEKGIVRETHDQKLRRVMSEEKKRDEEFDRYLQEIVAKGKSKPNRTDTTNRTEYRVNDLVL